MLVQKSVRWIHMASGGEIAFKLSAPILGVRESRRQNRDFHDDVQALSLCGGNHPGCQ
jgi:hypothetical protein